MQTKDWEIKTIEAATKYDGFYITGINHCTQYEIDREFRWSVNSVSDPRYFATEGLVIPENIKPLLTRRGGIGTGEN